MKKLFRIVLFVISWPWFRLWEASRHRRQILIGDLILARIRRKGPHCRLRGPGTIIGPEHLVLGEGVTIGEQFFIVATGGVEIGEYSILSRNVVIETQTHDYEGESLPFGSRMIRKPVRIGKCVWIGMGVSILPGVTIGEGAIIGLGSVVTKDIPPYSIAVGTPAVVKGKRDEAHFNELLSRRCFITLKRLGK